jgi:prophage tail gpP-like protein
MTDTVRIEVEHLSDPTEEIVVIDSWESYQVESNMMSPADNFTFRVQPRRDYIDFFRIPGHIVRLYIGDSLQMTGVIEATPDTSDTGGVQLQLTGRDFGGLLNDSAAPMLDITDQSLYKICELLLEPWSGLIPGIVTDYDDYRFITRAYRSYSGYRSASKAARDAKTQKDKPQGKVAAEAARKLRQKRYSKSIWGALSADKVFKYPTRPGASVWSILESMAAWIGVHIWMAPDGYVVMARPKYDQEASGRIFVKIDDDGNITKSNCTASRSPDIGDRYTEIQLVGQGYKTNTQKGKDLNSASRAIDPSESLWLDLNTPRRPYKKKIRSVSRAQDAKFLRRQGRTMVEKAIVKSYNFTVQVEGHRTSDITPPEDGRDDIGPLWAIDTVVDVDYQPKAVTGPHYILRREFKYDRGSGRVTDLTPIPTDIWLAYDHDKISDSQWTKQLRETMEHYAL